MTWFILKIIFENWKGQHTEQRSTDEELYLLINNSATTKQINTKKKQ